MPRSARLLALFLLALYSTASAAAPAPAPAPKLRETAKYGVYLQNARIGSMTTRTLDVTFAAKPAVRMEADTDLKLTTLGAATEMKIAVVQILDPKGRPLFTRFTTTSMGRTTTTTARYTPAAVLCTTDANGTKSSKTVPIPRGVTLVGDPQLSGPAGAAGLKVGQKAKIYFFEPLTQTIQEVSTEVVESETRKVGGREVRAFRMKSRSGIAGGSESWVDEKGELLEDNNPLGLRIVREDVDPSGTLAYQPPKDFAVATSVRTEVRIPEPRKTGYLRLKLSGVPEEKLLLSDARQQVVRREPEAGGAAAEESFMAELLVQARDLPRQSAPLLLPAAVDPGLGDATFLGLDDPAIRRQAQELAKDAADRAGLARRIRAWVKGHMQKPNNVGTPRAAPEIMKSRDGVCRDYATLFAALARAAGLPTRLCAGLLYFQDAFYYHAWVECRLVDSEDGWYPFDPTLDTDFVDATHIKLAQGTPTETFAIARAVGRLRAEILEHRPAAGE